MSDGVSLLPASQSSIRYHKNVSVNGARSGGIPDLDMEFKLLSLHATFEQRRFGRMTASQASDQLQQDFSLTTPLTTSCGLDALDQLQFIEYSRRKSPISEDIGRSSNEEAKLRAKYFRLRSHLAWRILHDTYKAEKSRLYFDILVEMFLEDNDTAFTQQREELPTIMETENPLTALCERLQKQEVIADSIGQYCKESLASMTGHNGTMPLPPLSSVEHIEEALPPPRETTVGRMIRKLRKATSLASISVAS